MYLWATLLEEQKARVSGPALGDGRAALPRGSCSSSLRVPANDAPPEIQKHPSACSSPKTPLGL